MSETDHVAARYRQAFRQHGRSSAAVLCPKGRHEIRYEALTAPFDLVGKRVLDFGCGLGHLSTYLSVRDIDCDYLGVDIVEEFIESNRCSFPDRKFRQVSGIAEIKETFDVVIASGVFNIRYFADEMENQQYVETRICELFKLASEGLSVDFMTSYVDFVQPDAFHLDPGACATFVATSLSRRFVINHQYLPYEFCVSAFRDVDVDSKAGIYA
jgi:cyclopropane fatty-acyl-phospholipid synthase-like methyltransferase